MASPVLIAADIVTAIVAVGLTGELWARLTYSEGLPAPVKPNEVQLPAELVEPDAILGQRFRANAVKFIESPHREFDVLHQNNDINLCGYGFVAPGARGPFAVVLGDAYTEGWGVMLDVTFVKEIERRLAKRPGMHKRTRLFNAGMSGYGAAQSYLLGRRLIESLLPEVVVFVYTSLMPVADERFLANAETDAAGLAIKAGPRSDSTRPSIKGKDFDSIFSLSLLAKVLKVEFDAQAAREAVIPGDPVTDLFAAVRGSQEVVANLHRRSLQHVAALATIAEKLGVQFILVHIPLPIQVDADEWVYGRAANGFSAREYPAPDIEIIEEFCATKGLNCTMTRSMLKETAARNASPVYYRYDYTLTEIGHHAIADHLIEIIAAALTKEGP